MEKEYDNYSFFHNVMIPNINIIVKYDIII